MHNAPSERRQDFSGWLRTGRIVVDDVEFKFNPYHDPSNGRFTTAVVGRGGSFGGGGATGSWDATEKRSRAQAHAQGNVPTPHRAVSPVPAAIAATRVAQPPLQPAQDLRRVVRNGYEYRIDSEDRTRSV